MLFNSVEFLIFFPIVTLIYYIVPSKIRHLWLLIASYYFYMCWNAGYALLIFASTLITYASGLMIEAIKQSDHQDDKQKAKMKKWVVAGSFIINLAILFFFKYFNFTMDAAARLLRLFHISFKPPAFDVLLPVGISFYTFQALSYTMDVYRGEIYAEKNFIRYALFVSFFPQLVAGPIERSKNLLKQLALPRKFDFDAAREGLLLMLWGFFLKIVLADRISLFVDTVYGNYEKYGGYYIILATVLFAVQIYCDFSGYSTIAMGTSKILGVELMENFNAPYLRTSVASFWRNWHISLTSWFKDYLYIPLGGSRKGKLRKYINKMIVFLVSGLWHGADFSYLVWGGINGLYQVIGEVLAPAKARLNQLLHLHTDTFGHRLAQGVVTFVLVDFTWLFFRAGSIHDAIKMLQSAFSVKNPWVLFDGSIYQCGLDLSNFWLMIICIGVLFFADICKYRGIAIRRTILRQDYWFRWLFIALSIAAILLFGKWGPSFDKGAFIYFQF